MTAVHRAWGDAIYPEGPLIPPGKPPRSITNKLRLPKKRQPVKAQATPHL